MDAIKKVVPASAKADTTKQKATADKQIAFSHFSTIAPKIQVFVEKTLLPVVNNNNGL